MTLSRRRFVKGTVATSALAGSGLIQIGCGNRVTPAPIVKAEITDQGLVKVQVNRYPDLAQPGGAVTIELDLPAGSKFAPAVGGGILLIHLDPLDPVAQPFAAVQSECPHAGCPLGYNAKDQMIECPCHSSRFVGIDAPDACIGKVVHLPANQDLRRFVVDYDPSIQVVTIHVTEDACNLKPLPPPVGGKVTLSFADFPALAAPGGSLVGTPQGFADSLIVCRVDATTAKATSSICTHLGCDLQFNPGAAELDCPCHGSAFTLDGEVNTGPADINVKPYAATVAADSIVVDVGTEKQLPSAVSGVVTLSLAQFPELANPGGSLVGTPQGFNRSLLICRVDDVTVKVTSSLCTHLNCDLHFNARAGEIDCPCHGSVFTLDGMVTNGPATVNLKTYAATLSADSASIIITVA